MGSLSSSSASGWKDCSSAKERKINDGHKLWVLQALGFGCNGRVQRPRQPPLPNIALLLAYETHR